MSGETIIFISLLFWVVVVMATDVAAKKVDCLSLAIVEDLVTSILTIIAALFLESEMLVYPYTAIMGSWDLILIVAAVEGAAVVFGILGQVHISPSTTALISSSASVYAAIGGYFFLHESSILPAIKHLFQTYSSKKQSQKQHDNYHVITTLFFFVS